MRLEIKNLSKTCANGVTGLKTIGLSVGNGMFRSPGQTELDQMYKDGMFFAV